VRIFDRSSLFGELQDQDHRVVSLGTRVSTERLMSPLSIGSCHLCIEAPLVLLSRCAMPYETVIVQRLLQVGGQTLGLQPVARGRQEPNRGTAFLEIAGGVTLNCVNHQSRIGVTTTMSQKNIARAAFGSELILVNRRLRGGSAIWWTKDYGDIRFRPF
jgi:hypothetical protein